jgi:membrane carboxypeptidase/penicillin-binding protein
MGYPNKRVSMTDVHGEPQQGGYLPAEIWHAYMAAVTEGKPCVEFPPSKEAISYEPFYGKYASTGLALAASEARTEHGSQPKPKKPASKGNSAPKEAPEPPLQVVPSRPAEPPAKEPSVPPAQHTAEEPVDKQTGGAAPG